MIDDIITTAIERPGVFLVSFVLPILALCYIGIIMIGAVKRERQRFTQWQERKQRAKEYERIFRRKYSDEWE
jgi:hypothetical protein